MAAIGKLASKPIGRKVCLYVTMACGDVKSRRELYVYGSTYRYSAWFAAMHNRSVLVSLSSLMRK
jgi:hypothetical protein